MSLVKGKNTKPELAVRKFLWATGYRYRLHYKNLPGAPDIVFPSKKKVVFVHGCFWHGHECRKGKLPKTRTEFWEEKIQRNRKRDKANEKVLRKLGWESRVIWECQTKNEKALERLVKFLSK
jgi:DNA mismatch endonuclease (patch repair protein)